MLVASCKEGLGEHVFERWMTTSESAGQMIEKIQQHFELGGHKAAAIAMVLKKARVMLVSDLDDDFVRSIFLEPYKDIKQAIDEAIKAAGNNAKIIVMPYGGSTLPCLEE